MLDLLFFPFAALTLSPTPISASPSPSPVARPRPSPRFHADELFSLRARRRFAAYLRLRLLELREENLSRAADAVERHVPLETLLPTPRP